jgi:hypothetical protein
VTHRENGGIRRGFILLWTLVGLVLLAAATWLADGWRDGQFWSSVLVNLGTTIFLAGFLVWLERRLVATTRTVAKEAATEAASAAATVAAEEATRVLSERLDAVQERFEQQLADQVAKEDSAVSALSSDISYGSVFTAMTTAKDLGAARSELFVSAGESLDSPVVGVRLAIFQQEESFGVYSEPQITGLELSVDTSLLGSAYLVETEWDADDDPIEVFSRLRSEMVRVGYGPEAKGLNVDRLFRNLKVGLEDALAGRRGDDGAWRGRETLLDVISDDWIVSELGIEHRTHGLVAAAPPFRVQSTFWKPFVPPPVPDWTDEETWKIVTARARARLVHYDLF